MFGIYDYIIRAEAAQEQSDQATDPAEREAFSEIAIGWCWLIDYVERTEALRPIN
jgi:hypothetical protein